jgi:hypothetical protein
MPAFLRRAPELKEALSHTSPQEVTMTITIPAILNVVFQSTFSAPLYKG